MNEMTTVLCIPEKYVPIILHQYHDEVLSGHPGVRKLTEISRRYYFPGLHTIIRQYVISCLKFQSMKRNEENASIHYPRIPLDYRPMMRFSMGIKHMPPSKLEFSKLLVSGVIIMTMIRCVLLEHVYCIKHVRLGGVLLSLCVWQTGVCLIYSGLTQGQGHTVRHPLLFNFFEPIFLA